MGRLQGFLVGFDAAARDAPASVFDIADDDAIVHPGENEDRKGA